MKLAKVLVSLGAIVSLVACNKSDGSVSKQKFVEEAQKAQEQPHGYNWATLTYTEVMTYNGAEIENETIEACFWYSEYDGWDIAIGEVPEDFPPIVGLTADLAAESMGEVPGGYSVKFYLNPLKIVTKGSQTVSYKAAAESMTVSGTTTMIFDEHALLTSYVVNTTMKSGGETAVLSVNASVVYEAAEML